MSVTTIQKIVSAAASMIGVASFLASPTAQAESCTVNGSQLQLTVHADKTYTVTLFEASGSNLSGQIISSSTGIGGAGGTATGSIAGNAVDSIVDWLSGGGTHFRGAIGPDGFAHGTATGSSAKDSTQATEFAPGNWDSAQPLTCPAAKPAEAPVTNAITLAFSPPNLGSITATISNSSDLNAKCTYDASATNLPLIPKTHRDFTVGPKASTDLTLNGFNTGASYHAVVSCHDASGKQTQEIGHAEQDVTF
jgi:hypothetical protein